MCLSKFGAFLLTNVFINFSEAVRFDNCLTVSCRIIGRCFPLPVVAVER